MISKVIIVWLSISTVSATVIHEPGLVDTGASSRFHDQDADGNYAFGYDIVDANGARNSRSETGDAHGNKKGSYALHDIDGRARKVNYIADEHGFRVAISTNEPGTANSAPANAVIASSYVEPAIPVAVATQPQLVPSSKTKKSVSVHTVQMPLIHPFHTVSFPPIVHSTKSAKFPPSQKSQQPLSNPVVSHVAIPRSSPPATVSHLAPADYSKKSVALSTVPKNTFGTPLAAFMEHPFHSLNFLLPHTAPVRKSAYIAKSLFHEAPFSFLSPVNFAKSTPDVLHLFPRYTPIYSKSNLIKGYSYSDW